jgi:outer membrane receptor for ferrienterochelin and colicins
MRLTLRGGLRQRRATLQTAAARAAFAVLLGANRQLAAQSIDYGALEALFSEPVTTSVTGSPQRVSHVPADIEIVTAEDIRRSGAQDIPGVLRHVGEVDVWQWTADQSDISVRGYNQPFSPRVLVLINGRQVYADYFSFTPWSTLPVELAAIRQIEIVKGPASALFGFNAAGGVINIITYNPLYDDLDTVSLTGGTQHFGQASASTTLKIDDQAAFRISGGGRSDRDFSTPIPPLMAAAGRSDNKRNSVDLDGIIQVAPHVQVRLEASHSNADLFQISPQYSSDYSQYHASSVKASVIADGRFGLVEAGVYHEQIEQISAPLLPGLFLDVVNPLTVLQLQDAIKVAPNHTLRAAVEKRFDSANTTVYRGGNVSYEVLSESLMWEWRLTPDVTLTNAIRNDRLSLQRTGSVPFGYPFSNADWNRDVGERSYNSGWVWNATSRDTVRLMASRGVLLPSLEELGGFVLVTPFGGSTGSPTVHPTIVTNYELDWDRVISGPGIAVRAGAFHERTSDLVTLDGEPIQAVPVPYTATSNAGDSTASGLALGVKSSGVRDWHWSLNYRYEWINDQLVPAARNDAVHLDFEDTTPHHVLKGGLGWSRGRWEVDGFVHYQSASNGLQVAANSLQGILVPIHAYVSADTRIAYSPIKHLTLSVNGKNITTATQRQTSGPAVERQVAGTVRYDF